MEKESQSKTIVPSDEVVVKINGSTFVIKTPNTGQLIDIETAKLRYSKNMHSSILYSNSRQSVYVYTMIDAVSTMSVLVPDLAKTFEIDNLINLSVFKMKELVDVYMKSVLPWMESIMDFLNGVEKQLLATDGDKGTGASVEPQV